jgi:hypothetical protein
VDFWQRFSSAGLKAIYWLPRGYSLLAAARDPSIPAQQVLGTVKKAQAFLEPSDAGTDRAKVLAQAEQEAKARL